MHVETIETTPAAPCTVTGGDRTFSGACRRCPAFAIGCSPTRPGEAPDDREPTPVAPADDLKAMQKACAGSPCLATGEARIFAGTCRSCPAFGLRCFPARPVVA